MLTANEIRDSFKKFFESKQHAIVPSAPMVIKDDPTLMFTNAGMNQWKDIILGTRDPEPRRRADTQKCLRVSGKHNDLEEVGHDTYHHTMFEMLGNWSFGDYFKEGAIDMAWEYLVDVLKLNPDDLYVTVFEGSPEENIPRDDEAARYWAKHVPEDHIINGNKHDNFWEMGDTGPCGPCSEIHVDSRTPEQRKASGISGRDLVNKDDPQVIEIWNLVFMQFNRKADGSLEKLSMNVIDTGMGFERLVRMLQGKHSNYDTDVFQPIIKAEQQITGLKYTTFEEEANTQHPTPNTQHPTPNTQHPRRHQCGHARLRRPPACRLVLYCRRSAAVERQGRLRHPSHSASCRALCLHLPRTERGLPAQARAHTGKRDGRCLPRAEGTAAAHHQGD